MNLLEVVLPQLIHLNSLQLRIDAIQQGDKQFYIDIYTDAELMKFITDDINLMKVKSDFKLVVAQSNRKQPKYISYIINLGIEKMGMLGIKLLSGNAIEIGMILRQQFQNMGWSKSIKKQLIPIIQETLRPDQIVAYCRHDNGAENHVNKDLGFINQKQFIHKSKQYLMNKWVLNFNLKQSENNSKL